jgi:hypothetical protein
MQFVSPADFAAAIEVIEMELGIRYPAYAAELFAELSTIIGTDKNRGLFQHAHLLLSAAEVAAERDELGHALIDGCLLSFLHDEQGECPDIYGFDLSDPGRIVAYSVHAIVQRWNSRDGFLDWVRTFVPRGQAT